MENVFKFSFAVNFVISATTEELSSHQLKKAHTGTSELNILIFTESSKRLFHSFISNFLSSIVFNSGTS
jgi:hypothetical protein